MEGQEGRQRHIPKRLDFGYITAASYNKHTIQVKSIFWNPNINAFVSYDEKNIHIWEKDTGRQLFNVNFFDTSKTHSISCMVYSIRYHLYLAVSTDFKLLIYNEHLNFIASLPLRIRLINFAYFYEKESKFVTAGIDGCFIFDFIVKSKYEPK